MEGLQARRLIGRLYAWLTSSKGLPQILNFHIIRSPLLVPSSPLEFRRS